MARRKVNKTQAIREAIAAAPGATPKEIAHSLKLLKITPTYVSNIKSKMKETKKRKTSKTKKTSTKVDLAELIKAKKMVDDLGGVEKAKEMLDALSKLQ